MIPRPPANRPWYDSGPDLQTQFEDLLAAVWAAEEEWRLDDRIDLSVKLQRPDKKAA